jgi:hypothetical protein
MARLFYAFGAVLTGAAAAFCVFGFLAAGEAPAEAARVWHLMYSAAFVACVSAAGKLGWSACKPQVLAAGRSIQ